MDAKDLMIGDWINTPEHNDLRVTEVCQAIVYVESEDRPKYFCALELVPIPLTEDILFNNGFELTDNGRDGAYCYGMKFYLEYSDKYNDMQEFGCNICGCTLLIRYVHELQHILRICGLTELADNFKLKKD